MLLPALISACFRPSPAPYTPRDPALAGFPLFFYPSAVASAPAKAFVFFVGNDIGFWGAHQDLAKRLAGAGYHVVGFDTKLFFSRLPADTAARARMFADSVTVMIALARRELGADSIPVVLGGHSLGAEVAGWIAVHAPPPRLAGVLLISARGRGHLQATLSDIASASRIRQHYTLARASGAKMSWLLRFIGTLFTFACLRINFIIPLFHRWESPWPERHSIASHQWRGNGVRRHFRRACD